MTFPVMTGKTVRMTRTGRPPLTPEVRAERVRLGALLQEQRVAAGLTPTELAVRLGVSPAYVHHIEAGRRRLTEPMAERMAEILGCEVAA